MRISDWSSDVCSSDLPLLRSDDDFVGDVAALLRGGRWPVRSRDDGDDRRAGRVAAGDEAGDGEEDAQAFADDHRTLNRGGGLAERRAAAGAELVAGRSVAGGEREEGGSR